MTSTVNANVIVGTCQNSVISWLASVSQAVTPTGPVHFAKVLPSCLCCVHYYCRMTNCELLCWLVEMQSCDVDHYHMINMSGRPCVIIMINSHCCFIIYIVLSLWQICFSSLYLTGNVLKLWANYNNFSGSERELLQAGALQSDWDKPLVLLYFVLRCWFIRLCRREVYDVLPWQLNLKLGFPQRTDCQQKLQNHSNTYLLLMLLLL